MADMTQQYAQEYSPQAIQDLTNQYASLLEPTYARSSAQIANTLGGRGTLYGTPGSNKLQLLQGQKMQQVGQFGQGLLTEALGKRQGERLTAEQRAYETPYSMAQLTGYLPGTSGTYNPQTGWSWTGGQQETLAGQTGRTTAEAARQQALAEQQKAQATYWQGILNALGTASGGLASSNPLALGGLVGWLQSLLGQGIPGQSQNP